MALRLNRTAFDHARRLIAAGRFMADQRDSWPEHRPTTEQENELIRLRGMDEFARWHLGINDAKDPSTKGCHGFLLGDFTNVHRCALLSADNRSGQCNYADIEDAAIALLRMIDTFESRSRGSRTLRRDRRAFDIVDEASIESFPASDPPSWTPILGQRLTDSHPSGDEYPARPVEAKAGRGR